MDYNPISSFLDRFRKILHESGTTQTIIQRTIIKHIGIEIESNKITTKGNLIRIQGSPMLHNEIMIHKQGILSDIKELLPESRFTDIRY